jgi:hypothetical protein
MVYIDIEGRCFLMKSSWKKLNFGKLMIIFPPIEYYLKNFLQSYEYCRPLYFSAPNIAPESRWG